MKKSIAKRMARRFSLILFAALLILILGGFFMVTKTVSADNDKYSSAVLGFYVDSLAGYSLENRIPIDTDHTEYPVSLGDNICRNYGVDFIYIYTVGDNYDSVDYIAASISQGKADKDPGDHLIGYHVECELLPEERALWDGERNSVRVTLDNSYGHEITNLRLMKDCNGNRIIAGVDMSYENVIRRIAVNFLFLVLAVIAVIIGVGVAAYFIISKRISVPAGRISRSMQEYITDGERSDTRLEVTGDDEFAMISSAFNSMTDDIAYYMESTKRLTEEQANRRTELEIASSIQLGFLPPAEMDCPCCSVRAMMTPARDVGGDLYDYIDLGAGRILTVVADVSGKGISASLLMSVTLTLIRQFARMGLPPHEILAKVNDALAENNARMLFVTAFVGIYDSCKGTFTYSNAGHNRPYIVGKTLKKLDGASGALLGIYEGETYVSETVNTESGDIIFLYTDGVTEAVNSFPAFWGNANLEETLRFFRLSGGDNPVEFVYDALKKFAGNAEQHDDITMLALTVRSGVSLELDVNIREFEKIKAEILKLPVSRTMQLNLCLAAEEIFVNICSYAFRGRSTENEKIGFSLKTEGRIELCFTDGGAPFNPFEKINVPDEDGEMVPGGLGRFITASVTDESGYEYRDGKNILTLVKYYEETTK